jgi:hypothetical protein
MASAQILTNGKALYAYNGTEWVPLNTAGNLVNSTRWQYTAVGSETSLSGNDDNGESLIYTPGYEQVYLNGVLLARDADYAATTGTTITGLTALTAGYIVEVIAYNNINVGNTYTQAQIDSKVANTFERWVDTLSASATVLSGLDDNSNTLSYTPGLEQVYVNGILLLPSEYTATSGSSIVLSEAAVASDVIQVYALKNFRVPNTYTILQTDDQFLTKTSASADYIPDSIVDAKGDIITATADNTPARLAVSSASTAYLRPDTSSSTGLKWDEDAWTSYTPIWTGVSSNPVINNGTITGKYKQIGKTVFFSVFVTMGSTTTYGSGEWRISLPVTAASAKGVIANLLTLDSGSAWYHGLALTGWINSTTTIALVQSEGGSGMSGFTSINPFTWTTNDEFFITGNYEAA